MDDYTLYFRSSCSPAVASRQLASLEQALAEAGGELKAGGHGLYAVGGSYKNCSRWALIQLMQDHGFILDRIVSATG